MKKVILLALLMPLPAFGQIVENFESENIVNWVQSPGDRWKPDTTTSLSGKFSLHHVYDNPDAGIDRIGIPIINLHPSQDVTKWSFLVRYGYDPSSLNNWAVFLMSDTGSDAMSPDGGTNGYAIGVNLTGSDDTLRLWKVIDDQVISVVNCRINWQTDIGITDIINIQVERSKDGEWKVSVTSLSGDFIGTASGTDPELFSNGWFGIYYRYSSTRDRLLWLDDIRIEGSFYSDIEAPVITRCEAAGKNSVEITLNEEPESGNLVPSNFFLNPEEISASSVQKIANLRYRINFGKEFNNRSVNYLNIYNLCDQSANCSQNIRIGFTPEWAETGDVVISEIMADPLPEVSLPGKEYIEITNRTEYAFNLKNWKLSTTSQVSFLPEFLLAPYGTTIVCATQDTLLFKELGKVTGIKQFPSLTDDGRLIYLSDSTGTLIHGVEYSSSWYNDELKSDGGWSLEMIDTGFPFYGQENWTASVSKTGGTPGKINSVSESNPDNSFYGIRNVFPEDSLRIHISFSEPVFDLGRGTENIKIGENRIADVYQADPLFREYMITLIDPLQRSDVDHLEISKDIFDFAGNAIKKSDFDFGLCDPARGGDILFNEILFNPWPGDPDYIELYNGSDRVIDASRLQIVSVDDASGEKSDAVPVSAESRCILPGEYYAITTDIKKITDRYFSGNPDCIFKTGSLPSMSDDKGHLILFNRELEIIDELKYTDDMHYSLLSTFEGVALEKTSPGSNSEEAANWHSATESSGWGTPGARNSIFADMPETDNKLVFSSTKISPDNDGNEDFLTIILNLQDNGNVVSIMVFDEAGNFVRDLARNLFAGSQASVIWDGTGADGSMLRTGIYIILITLYNDTGKTEKWKKVCTVIR